MKGQTYQSVVLAGGLDLLTPAVILKPGYCLDAVNCEPELTGGYTRVAGVERFDGRAAPSDAVYYLITVDDIGSITVGDTLTGGTSGATSEVIAIDGNDIGITDLTGNYTVGETVGGQTLTVAETIGGQVDEDLSIAWLQAAQEYYRDLIAEVPGAGPVLGVVQHEEYAYAWRNNVGNTLAVMHVSSASGWTEVTMFSILKFDAGTMTEGEIAVGDTVTGATSGASATVKKFIKHGGSYSSDAYGYMVVDVTSGAFTDNEKIQKSAVDKADADGADYAIEFLPDGKFEFVPYNFFASSTTYNLYGCDGVNPAFEFDGTVLTPILLNTQADDVPAFNKPHLIEAHDGYLWMAFPNGSLQRSEPGLPLNWSGFLGAAEFGMGAEITGVKSQTGGVLAVYTTRQTYGIYGRVDADLEVKSIADRAGAILYSVQLVGTTYALDDRGITRMDRVQSFGDFESATISRRIKSLVDLRKSFLVGSVLVRSKNQYRLIFSNGTCIVMGDDNYLGDDSPSFTEIQWPFSPYCISNQENALGREVILMGDDDGFVYQLEKGTSYDGASIEFALRLSYNDIKSPRSLKAYRRLVLDMDLKNASNVTLSIATEFSYGDAYSAAPGLHLMPVEGVGGYWDISSWDQFFWQSATVISRTIPLTGVGRNIGILIYHTGAMTDPFTVQALHLHYLIRRLDRG